MKTTTRIIILLLFPFLLTALNSLSPQWGFYAHKIINRMAVFILPPEMIVFYKKNIDYISSHSTDPDKRRYAVSNEAIKHYMDLDHWGKYPYPDIPHNLEDALCRFARLSLISLGGDTLLLKDDSVLHIIKDSVTFSGHRVSYPELKEMITGTLLSADSGTPVELSIDSINKQLHITLDKNNFSKVIVEEHFTEHGIAPFHVYRQYLRLKLAFRRNDLKAILRLSSDLGHYVADIHVPLHATSNYNGQLTGQEGIHAFWESRLPELFAESEYHYFVGKAQYIKDVQEFAWNTILESNHLHIEVLETERKLQAKIPEDKHFSFEERLGRTVRVPSREYSEAYHKALKGMVKQRMQDAVFALGSIWFTAWVDAGQPVLIDTPDIHWSDKDIQEMQSIEDGFSTGVPLGRSCK